MSPEVDAKKPSACHGWVSHTCDSKMSVVDSKNLELLSSAQRFWFTAGFKGHQMGYRGLICTCTTARPLCFPRPQIHCNCTVAAQLLCNSTYLVRVAANIGCWNCTGITVWYVWILDHTPGHLEIARVATKRAYTGKNLEKQGSEVSIKKKCRH